MIVAKIHVEGVCAIAEYRKMIPVGIIGAKVKFEYAAEIWQGLQKTVVFRAGQITKDVITDADEVTIPPEVVAKRNVALQVGVYGVDADGNLAIPTIWADLGTIRDATDPSGDTTTDPSLPVWAQLQAMIGDLDKLDTTVKENLVAAVNEAMTKGGGTVDEAEIQRIVEEYLAENPPTVTETDPTVPAWAKEPQKPTYTAGEVGALSADTLPAAINIALAQAKDSGEFDGAPGEDGNPGAPGADGYSPTASVTQTDTGAVITITDKTGTTTAALKNGADGQPGATGATPNIQIGTVETLEAGSAATASMDGTPENPILNLGIPQGAPGSGGGSGISVTGATVGQTVKIAAVDDDGVPTAWEPVDLPGEEVWEDICDITFAEDVLAARILTSDMGIHYKKIEASGQGFSAKLTVCFSNASANGEHKDIYNSVQNWSIGSIKWNMMAFTRFSLYPVADKAFECINIGGGISAQQYDNSPERYPCAWGIDGNHTAATCFVSNYSAGGIDQITIYSNDGTTVIPAGARLQIRGVRA